METTLKCKQCGEYFQGYRNRKLCDKCSSKWNLYHRAYREKRPERAEFYKEYQKINKNKIKKQYNKWRSQIKSPIVYFMIDDMDKFIYIGSTFFKNTRMTNHFGNGKIKTWIEKYHLARVEYIDLSDIVDDKEQLEYIERLFIQSDDPIKNKKLPNPQNIDLVTLRELKAFYGKGNFDYYNYDFAIWSERNQQEVK